MPVGYADLPANVLQILFSFFTLEDLQMTLRNVCKKWRITADSVEVLRNYDYCPELNATMDDITRNIKVFLSIIYRGQLNIVDALSEYGRHMQRISMTEVEMTAGQLDRMIICLKKLKLLEITIPNDQAHNFLRIIGQSTSLNSLILSGKYGEIVDYNYLLYPITMGCPELKMVTFKSFNFESSDLSLLLRTKSPMLIYFHIRNTTLTNVVGAIQDCRKLRKLVLINVKIVDNFEFNPLKFKKLTKFIYCYSNIEYVPLVINFSYKRLVELNLSYATGAINLLIPMIIRKCRNLKLLRLDGLADLHDFTLIYVPNCCQFLEQLSLIGCRKLTENSLYLVYHKCNFLKHLDFSRNTITDGMLSVILGLQRETIIYLKDCVYTISSNFVHNVVDFVYLSDNEKAVHVRNAVQRLVPNVSLVIDRYCDYFNEF